MAVNVYSQKVSGSWYGRAEIILEGNNSSYLTELIIKQKGNDVEGVMGYYYRNTYQSFIIRGKYDPETRLVQIKNIPLAYFKSNKNMPMVDCLMDFEAILVVSKVKSNLKGYFLRNDKYKWTCPDLNLTFTLDEKVKLDSALKEAISVQKTWKAPPELAGVDDIPLNFKNEPEMVGVPQMEPVKRDPPVIDPTFKKPEITRTAPPVTDPAPVAANGRINKNEKQPVKRNEDKINPTLIKPEFKTEGAISQNEIKKKTDTSSNAEMKKQIPSVERTIAKENKRQRNARLKEEKEKMVATREVQISTDLPTKVQERPLPQNEKVERDPVASSTQALKREFIQKAIEKLEKRKPLISNEIEVNSDSLRVTFYDNGDIDGDTVTVFYNKFPVLSNQSLNAQGVNIYLKLDTKNEIHEITMYAENLGSIPPNTALMIIYDGQTRHEIFLTSNYTQNGTVRIRKKKVKQTNIPINTP